MYICQVRFASSCVDREEAQRRLAAAKEMHDASRFRVACKKCEISRVWFGGVSTELAPFPTKQGRTGPVSLLSTETEPRGLGWTGLACYPSASRCDLVDQEEEACCAASKSCGLMAVNVVRSGEHRKYRELTIMSHKHHMVRINGTERGETVAHNAEQGDQGIVDDVDRIKLPITNINPPNQEQNPGKAEEGDECGIKGDEKAQRSPSVFAKSLESLFDLGSPGVQHVPDIIIQGFDVLFWPTLERGIVGEDGVLGVTEDRG
jgi:hypothetical protein